jgi:hypothetical protein
LNKKIYAVKIANYYSNIKKNQETARDKFIYGENLKEIKKLSDEMLTQKDKIYMEKLKFVKMLRDRGFFIY